MVKDWKQFDNKLREIALIDVAVMEAQKERELALIDAETKFRDATDTRLAVRATLVRELEKFYRANRREVEKDGARSKQLHFGRVGLRLSAVKLNLLKGVKWGDVLQRIKEHIVEAEQATYIRTKETVNKDAVKQLEESMLTELGVKTGRTEQFFVEPFVEKATEAVA